MNVSTKVFVLAAVGAIGFAALRSHGSAAPAPVPDGKVIFAARCASCHQATGLGGGPFPPLAGNSDVTAADTSAIIATVLNGKTGPITVNGIQYSGAMPAWKAQLTNAEVAAVLTYIRSAWTNKAPAVSEDQVALAGKPVMLSGADIFAAKCAACHQPNGQGSDKFPPLDGNPHVILADPNDIVATIVNGRSGSLSVNGKTYAGTMPTWKGQLSNPDIAAVATYIRSSWSNKAGGVTEAMVNAAGFSISAAIGGSIFAQRCASCHGAKGGGGPFPALAGNAHVTAADPSGIIGTIKRGKNIMPSWKGQLSNADIAAVVTYLRSAWGNKAAGVTEPDVAAVK
jgi:mono/diheme cytochrome c family protein